MYKYLEIPISLIQFTIILRMHATASTQFFRIPNLATDTVLSEELNDTYQDKTLRNLFL